MPNPPLLPIACVGAVYWRSVEDLASLVSDDEVSSIVLDMNGSVGYLKHLLHLYPNLGAKVQVGMRPFGFLLLQLANYPFKWMLAFEAGVRPAVQLACRCSSLLSISLVVQPRSQRIPIWI